MTFNEFVTNVQNQDDFFKPLAFALAKKTRSRLGDEAIFYDIANVNFCENYGTFACYFAELDLAKYKNESEFCIDVSAKQITNILKHFEEFKNDGKRHENIATLSAAASLAQNKYCLIVINRDEAPKSIAAVYLKLHLLSRGKAKLRSLNLAGAFGLLPNLAWSGNECYELEYLRQNEADLKFSGKWPCIDYVDKFPRFLQCVLPENNVRILDSGKVRFGAQLAAGTTVMPGASYINFNAGTLGAVMCEGRISSSAIVGANSDVGGGASILGVLSGTDGTPLSIGERCLLGANSVTGIVLGDDCVVDAGIAILAGSKVKVLLSSELQAANPNFAFENRLYKAAELSGLNALHFRINSQNGELTAQFNKKAIKLNAELH